MVQVVTLANWQTAPGSALPAAADNRLLIFENYKNFLLSQLQEKETYGETVELNRDSTQFQPGCWQVGQTMQSWTNKNDRVAKGAFLLFAKRSFISSSELLHVLDPSTATTWTKLRVASMIPGNDLSVGVFIRIY